MPRTTEELLKDADDVAGQFKETGPMKDNLSPDGVVVAEALIGMAALIDELSTKVREQDDMLKGMAIENIDAEMKTVWRPSELPPKDNTWVLVVNEFSEVEIGKRCEMRFVDVHYDHIGPTHWMPLPPLPTKEKENEVID